MSRCVIISSSPKIEISFLRDEVLSDDFIICADGGYNHAEKMGIVPDVLIGDLIRQRILKKLRTELNIQNARILQTVNLR